MSKKKTVKKKQRRANGEGSIYLRNDGRWGAAVSLGFDENGLRIRKVVTGKTPEIVTDKMKALLDKEQLREDPPTQSLPTITGNSSIAEIIYEFKQHLALKIEAEDGFTSRTYENYTYSLAILEKGLGNMMISRISVEIINHFFRSMANLKKDNGQYKYSQTSIARVKFMADSLFKRAYQKKWISENPFTNTDLIIPKSRQTSTLITSYTVEELKMIHGALVDHKTVYPAFLLMMETGVRTQEALALRWKDIDFVKQQVLIRSALTIEVNYDNSGKKLNRKTVSDSTKTKGSQRVLSISQPLAEMLKEWRRQAPSVSKTQTGDEDYVFGNRLSPYWTYAGFRSSVNDCIKRKCPDMGHICLHRIRHSVATMMAEDGVQLLHLMKQLGHTQTKTTMKYIDQVSSAISESNRDLIVNGWSNRLGTSLYAR